MVNAVRSPALRAYSTFGISDADRGNLPPYGRSRVRPLGDLRENTLPSCFSLAQTAIMGHVAIRSVSYSTGMG